MWVKLKWEQELNSGFLILVFISPLEKRLSGEVLDEKLSGLNAALGVLFVRERDFSFADSPQQDTQCAIAAAIFQQGKVVSVSVCVCEGGQEESFACFSNLIQGYHGPLAFSFLYKIL